MSPDEALATGVYYLRKDYAGVWRRLLIDLVDVPIAALLSIVVIVAAWSLVPAVGDSPGIQLLLFASVWFVYFVLLKRSRFRTPGYIIGGARIVSLKGHRPSILSLLARLLFAFVGPMNFLIDLFWITGDPNGQAIRDKFAGTYVVRVGAQPAGAGPIRFGTYMFWGMTFLFKEVKSGAP
jgi:uncharacterized RDD family membrane protein YckC